MSQFKVGDKVNVVNVEVLKLYNLKSSDEFTVEEIKGDMVVLKDVFGGDPIHAKHLASAQFLDEGMPAKELVWGDANPIEVKDGQEVKVDFSGFESSIGKDPADSPCDEGECCDECCEADVNDNCPPTAPCGGSCDEEYCEADENGICDCCDSERDYFQSIEFEELREFVREVLDFHMDSCSAFTVQDIVSELQEIYPFGYIDYFDVEEAIEEILENQPDYTTSKIETTLYHSKHTDSKSYVLGEGIQPLEEIAPTQPAPRKKWFGLFAALLLSLLSFSLCEARQILQGQGQFQNRGRGNQGFGNYAGNGSVGGAAVGFGVMRQLTTSAQQGSQQTANIIMWAFPGKFAYYPAFGY